MSFQQVLLQQAAIEALEKIGPSAKTAIPVLAELLVDNQPYVREMAAKAIRKIETAKNSGGTSN